MSSETFITAIILAAGMSRRMGSTNKLLMEVEGMTVLERSVRPIVEAGLARVIVVTGYQREKVESCLGGYNVEFFYNEQFRDGMGTSLARGVASIGESELDGIMVSLGDLPCLKIESVNAVIEAFSSKEGKRIVVPTFCGEPGHPIILPARYEKELNSLRGDEGARRIIGREENSVVRLELDDKGVCLDLDRPGA